MRFERDRWLSGKLVVQHFSFFADAASAVVSSRYLPCLLAQAMYQRGVRGACSGTWLAGTGTGLFQGSVAAAGGCMGGLSGAQRPAYRR